MEPKRRLKKYDSKAQSIRGIILGLIQKFSSDAKVGKTYSAQELQIIFGEALSKFNKYFPQKIVQNEIEIVSGWKGIGNLEIFGSLNNFKGFTEDFVVKEPIKNKDTGEVEYRFIEVKKEDLNRIMFIIKGLRIGEPVKCYYISKKLGYTEWKELWKERQEYFQFYYYPIKVTEAMRIIHYSGRGTITRLK